MLLVQPALRFLKKPSDDHELCLTSTHELMCTDTGWPACHVLLLQMSYQSRAASLTVFIVQHSAYRKQCKVYAIVVT